MLRPTFVASSSAVWGRGPAAGGGSVARRPCAERCSDVFHVPRSGQPALPSRQTSVSGPSWRLGESARLCDVRPLLSLVGNVTRKTGRRRRRDGPGRLGVELGRRPAAGAAGEMLVERSPSAVVRAVDTSTGPTAFARDADALASELIVGHAVARRTRGAGNVHGAESSDGGEAYPRERGRC